MTLTIDISDTNDINKSSAISQKAYLLETPILRPILLNTSLPFLLQWYSLP